MYHIVLCLKDDANSHLSLILCGMVPCSPEIVLENMGEK